MGYMHIPLLAGRIEAACGVHIDEVPWSQLNQHRGLTFPAASWYSVATYRIANEEGEGD